MLCYKGPKTVEFRFLRPSYNFNIIYTWIAILNAILRKAELFAQEWKESNCDTEDMFDWWQSNYKSLNAILKEIYPENIYKNVAKVIEYIRIGTKNQEANGDFCGNCYEILDEAVNESC
jgi:hypothetical protein